MRRHDGTNADVCADVESQVQRTGAGIEENVSGNELCLRSIQGNELFQGGKKSVYQSAVFERGSEEGGNSDWISGV